MEKERSFEEVDDLQRRDQQQRQQKDDEAQPKSGDKELQHGKQRKNKSIRL